jgi:hypothetical protein
MLNSYPFYLWLKTSIYLYVVHHLWALLTCLFIFKSVTFAVSFYYYCSSHKLEEPQFLRVSASQPSISSSCYSTVAGGLQWLNIILLGPLCDCSVTCWLLLRFSSWFFSPCLSECHFHWWFFPLYSLVDTLTIVNFLFSTWRQKTILLTSANSNCSFSNVSELSVCIQIDIILHYNHINVFWFLKPFPWKDMIILFFKIL